MGVIHKLKFRKRRLVTYVSGINIGKMGYEHLTKTHVSKTFTKYTPTTLV